ncbi:MAG: nucleotidyl transferase AbiEii/AbiGii toxin family protein [Bacteroidetes bacterium]|nr:nucleotidyl transferase AbiEii/AbiGii toxin family protein [Bacteroidota bacterium]
MIPRRYIDEWKEYVYWNDNTQVEQDLIITRALVAIYNDDFLKGKLAFRGGTALYKLFLIPPARYSEDIDLVQIKAAPIGEILNHLRKSLSFIVAEKVTVNRGNSMTAMNYRYLADGAPPQRMKLKIEINCREHLAVYNYKDVNISIANTWFSGSAYVKTYEPEELLGTKLRALYQRSKGRDLFDLWYALIQLKLDTGKIIHAYYEYLTSTGAKIRKEDFIANVNSKIQDDNFRKDILGILQPDINFDIDVAYNVVKTEILEKL